MSIEIHIVMVNMYLIDTFRSLIPFWSVNFREFIDFTDYSIVSLVHTTQTHQFYGGTVQREREMLERITRFIFPTVLNVPVFDTLLCLLDICNPLPRNS